MPRLLVGLPSLLGDIQKYKKRFDVVELRPVDAITPRPATLRAWRKAAGPAFVFSVVLPHAVGELTPGAALDEALATSLEVARVLEARCIVLPTPPSVRPTATNRKRLEAVLAELPREGTVICWEPAGLWERDDVVATARALGVVPVLDASREALAAGPVAYTRLRALGKSATLGAAAVDRIAERLRGRREAFVIVEGGPTQAARVKTAIASSLDKRAAGGGSPAILRPTTIALVAEDEEQ